MYTDYDIESNAINNKKKDVFNDFTPVWKITKTTFKSTFSKQQVDFVQLLYYGIQHLNTENGLAYIVFVYFFLDHGLGWVCQTTPTGT